MPGHISTTKVYFLDSIIDWETLKNWTAMTNTISTIKYEPWSLTSSIQTQYCLLLEKDFWGAKLFKEDISCFDSIAVWIKWRLRQQNRVFFWWCFQFIKNMSPKGFHVIPVYDDTMFYWIIKFEYTFILFCSFTNENFLLILRDHYFLIHWSSHTTIQNIDLFAE